MVWRESLGNQNSNDMSYYINQYADKQLSFARLQHCSLWVRNIDIKAAGESWNIKAIQKIKWTRNVSNEDVLWRMDAEKRILTTILCRKINCIGHDVTMNFLLNEVIDGKLEWSSSMGFQGGIGGRRIQLIKSKDLPLCRMMMMMIIIDAAEIY